MLKLRLRHMWLRLDNLRLFFTITTRDDFMLSQRAIKHITSTYITINVLVVSDEYTLYSFYPYVLLIFLVVLLYK